MQFSCDPYRRNVTFTLYETEPVFVVIGRALEVPVVPGCGCVRDALLVIMGRAAGTPGKQGKERVRAGIRAVRQCRGLADRLNLLAETRSNLYPGRDSASSRRGDHQPV